MPKFTTRVTLHVLRQFIYASLTSGSPVSCALTLAPFIGVNVRGIPATHSDHGRNHVLLLGALDPGLRLFEELVEPVHHGVQLHGGSLWVGL